jgi:hypothetical protein
MLNQKLQVFGEKMFAQRVYDFIILLSVNLVLAFIVAVLLVSETVRQLARIPVWVRVRSADPHDRS